MRASISDVMGAAADASSFVVVADGVVVVGEPALPRRLFLCSSTRREVTVGTYDGHDGGGTSLGWTGFDTAVSCGWKPLTCVGSNMKREEQRRKK